MHHLYRWAKKDFVLFASFVLALLSCIIVPPSMAYIQYIDLHTLILLFCLMAVVEGLHRAEVFDHIAHYFLRHMHTERHLVMLLVLLCFVSSMCITNDVALITFVPFAIMLLRNADLTSRITSTVALMTIAANMGSMLTPVGNPQNLYLYRLSGYSLSQFMGIMLPYTTIALLLSFIFILLKTSTHPFTARISPPAPLKQRQAFFYGILFLLSLASVVHWISPWYLLLIVGGSILCYQPDLLRKLDYSLLLTFVFFFILSGNLKSFGPLHTLLQQLITGHERLTAIVVSQFISNVPAALLLSGYTEDITDLIIGCNLGGLGTLIASMASVISYKYVAHDLPQQRLRYLLRFSFYSIIFLACIVAIDYWMA